MKVNSGIIKGNFDKDISEKINIVKDFRLNLSKRKDVGDE